jgi:uncharacterized membrane protein
MQIALIISLALHVLSSVFWAGSSFTLARTGGVAAEKLFRSQMGAATIAIVTGAYLGHSVHGGSFGTSEQLLGAGALAALVAAAVQAALGGRAIHSLQHGTMEEAKARARISRAQRIAAGLLGLAALCMGAARYA